VVAHGTDPRSPPRRGDRRARKRVDLPDGGTRWLVTVARSSRSEGIDTVIPLRRSRTEPDVGYVIAAVGRIASERRRSWRHKLGVAIACGSGPRRRPGLPAVYNLDRCTSACRARGTDGRGGFGIRWWYASACGLPVGAGNSGGIPDAVRDGETAFSCARGSALADAVCRVLRRSGLASQLGQNGRRAARRTLTGTASSGPAAINLSRLLVHFSRHAMDDVRWFRRESVLTLVVRDCASVGSESRWMETAGAARDRDEPRSRRRRAATPPAPLSADSLRVGPCRPGARRGRHDWVWLVAVVYGPAPAWPPVCRPARVL